VSAATRLERDEEDQRVHTRVPKSIGTYDLCFPMKQLATDQKSGSRI
jgi:hypothetical protein